jgi:hypothetical protein
MEDSACVSSEKTKEEDGEGEQEQAANLSAAFCLEGLRWGLVCDGRGQCVVSDDVL